MVRTLEAESMSRCSWKHEAERMNPAGNYIFEVRTTATADELFERVWPFCVTSFWCLYYQLWTYFTPCSSVSIVNFEQVNAGWKAFLRIHDRNYSNNWKKKKSNLTVAISIWNWTNWTDNAQVSSLYRVVTKSS